MQLVHHALEESARRLPDKTALVCGDRRLTFAELDGQANRLANALLAEGVVPGDRVAVLLENSVEAVVSVFGILKAGAAFTLLSPSIKSEKLAWVLADERAAALIAADDGPRRKVVAEVPVTALPRTVMWVSPRRGGASYHELDWASLLALASERAPEVTVSPDAIGTIIYTSGTTGEPKGVVSLHRDMVFATTAIAAYLENDADDVLFCPLSLAFTYGLYQLLTAVSVGARLVLEKSFAFPMRALAVMERERVTGFPGVPTLYSLLLRLESLGRFDLSSLRYLTNAAAPLPVEVLDRVRQAFPQADFFSMYGQTECKRTCYLPPEELDRRPGSVGIPIPGTEVYIVDEHGTPVAPGEVGELVVVGPHVMAGYWEKPSQTAERLRPGRTPGEVAMYTGDLFRTDEEGFLYFVSRADDIIKTRGEKVSPNEIENSLRGLAGVRDVAAVGVADDLLGEAVQVFVVLDEDATVTERDVRRWCAERLEDFMVPKYVSFCAELPVSENGKTLRKELRACVA